MKFCFKNGQESFLNGLRVLPFIFFTPNPPCIRRELIKMLSLVTLVIEDTISDLYTKTPVSVEEKVMLYMCTAKIKYARLIELVIVMWTSLYINFFGPIKIKVKKKVKKFLVGDKGFPCKKLMI